MYRTDFCQVSGHCQGLFGVSKATNLSDVWFVLDVNIFFL